MKWILKKPSPSDMIRIRIGELFHFGIYISDSQVIAFGLPPTGPRKADDPEIRVISTDLSTFSDNQNSSVEKAVYSSSEKKIRHTNKQIIDTARASLGQNGYHILRNNCQHFVNFCVFGKKQCLTIDNIRRQWASRPILDVYVKKTDDQEKSRQIEILNSKLDRILPQTRKEEIQNTSDLILKFQKIMAWELLEKACFKSLGTTLAKLNPAKNPAGKWIFSPMDNGHQFYLSISHSQDFVAVAVSSSPVGVDIEDFSTFKKMKSQNIEKLLMRICSFQERRHVNKTVKSEMDILETLCSIWTSKEASYKEMKSQKKFVPSKQKINRKKMTVQTIPSCANKTYLAVCGDKKITPQIFFDT